MAKLDRSNEEEHLNWFDELLAMVPLDGLNIQRHMLKGDASDLIPRLALRKGIDVIVMGTVCRAGVPGLFIGNTAEKVLRHVSCSVLTIKPEGFVSPRGMKRWLASVGDCKLEYVEKPRIVTEWSGDGARRTCRNPSGVIALLLAGSQVFSLLRPRYR